LLEIFHDLEKIGHRKRIAIVVMSVVLGTIATIWKEVIADSKADEDKLALVKKDSLNRMDRIKFQEELIKRDSFNQIENQKRHESLVRSYADGLAQFNLRIDNLLPPISSIRIESNSDGLLLNYKVNQPIQNLRLVTLFQPFDETLSREFGERIEQPLQSKIGLNSVQLKGHEFIPNSILELMIKGDSPFLSTPIIRHNHHAGNVSDSVFVQYDNFRLVMDHK